MIKQLISDLAYDKISLSQALTRAKIISSKVKNKSFLGWLNNELSGYDYDDPLLPSYRKVRTSIFLTFNGQDVPVLVDTDNHEFNDSVWYHRFLEPISIIAEHIGGLSSSTGDIRLVPEQCAVLFDIMAEKNKNYQIYRSKLSGGYKRVAKAQIQNIIELTKQKLLDTLLELASEFPNLENEFEMTKENITRAQNIITNNIYGGNNPVTVAAGHHVEQRDIHNAINVNDYDFTELEKLGVEQEDIQALKKIIQSGTTKVTIRSKAMKWLGSVSASIAARGLYDNLPAINDFVHRLTE